MSHSGVKGIYKNKKNNNSKATIVWIRKTVNLNTVTKRALVNSLSTFFKNLFLIFLF